MLLQARAMLAQGRRRAAARLLLAHGSTEAQALLDTLPADGPHGAVLAERLRFGPPETWAGWRAGVGRVAVKIWPQGPELPPLPAAFRHPGVAPLVENGPLWRVTAWVEGQTLARRLKQGYSHQEALGWLSDVEAAMAALHAAGLSHGDLNPANVVVSPAGRAVLIDWGEPGLGDGRDNDCRALARLAARLTSPPSAASTP